MPTLLVGAGLSFGVARNAGDEHCGDLYHWADHILDTAADNDRVPLKLRLARALGITTEPRWTARVGIPLRGNTPRHRVIARLAREGRWASIWSLNWDTVLECALESVGFERDDARFRQPWCCVYTTHVTDQDVLAASRDGVLRIYKPHAIDLERSDVHVPLRVPNIGRPDLEAAARVFVALNGSSRVWDLSTFPGGLWDPESLRLVVPLPAWSERNALRSLRPLLHSWEPALSMLDRLDVMTMTPAGVQTAPEQVARAKAQLSGSMRLVRFADPGEIGSVGTLD